jgi:peptidoglycan/LPS O-acetylase OafA/YrhL
VIVSFRRAPVGPPGPVSAVTVCPVVTGPAFGPADTTTVAAPRTARLEALTGLRWFAAFGVFLFHVCEFYPLPGVRDTALFGNTGVTFFFVLSGFVLTWSFSPRDTASRFYWRRFARIWPALAASTALAVPVFYAGRGVALDRTEQWGIVASLVLVQAWIPAVLFSGNPAAWSLSDEGFFYMIFPAVVRPIVRAPHWVLGLLAFVLVSVNGALRWWAWGQPSVTITQERMLFVSPAGRVAEFLLGMVVAAAIRRGWRCRVPVWTAVAVTAAGLGALWYCHTHAQPYLPTVVVDRHPVSHAEQAMNQVMGPLYTLLIASVASRDLVGRWMLLRSRPLVALGRWSYAFYLVHATVLHWLVQHWTPQQENASWDNWRPASVALAAGLLTAVLLYALVEHPFEKLLRGLPGLGQPPRGDPGSAGVPGPC